MDQPGWGSVEKQVRSFQEAYDRGLIEGYDNYDPNAGPYTGEDLHNYRREYADLFGLEDKKNSRHQQRSIFRNKIFRSYS